MSRIMWWFHRARPQWCPCTPSRCFRGGRGGTIRGSNSGSSRGEGKKAGSANSSSVNFCTESGPLSGKAARKVDHFRPTGRAESGAGPVGRPHASLARQESNLSGRKSSSKQSDSQSRPPLRSVHGLARPPAPVRSAPPTLFSTKRRQRPARLRRLPPAAPTTTAKMHRAALIVAFAATASAFAPASLPALRTRAPAAPRSSARPASTSVQMLDPILIAKGLVRRPTPPRPAALAGSSPRPAATHRIPPRAPRQRNSALSCARARWRGAGPHRVACSGRRASRRCTVSSPSTST